MVNFPLWEVVMKLKIKMLRRGIRMPFECLAVLLGFATIPLLPRPWLLRFTECVGWIMSKTCVRQTKIMLANLDVVYGDTLPREEKRRIVRASGAYAALLTLDFFWFAWFTRRRIRKYVTCCESFREMVAENKAGMVLSAHFGNWELGAKKGAELGRNFVSIFAPLGISLTQRLLLWVRMKTGGLTVAREGAMMTLLKTVREGGIIAVLLDQRISEGEGGVFIDFFGKPALMSTVAGILSKRRKLPLHLITCKYLPSGHCHIMLSKTLSGECGLDEMEVTRWVARAMEEQIKGQPEQWLWMYRRWQDIPHGDDPATYPFYARE